MLLILGWVTSFFSWNYILTIILALVCIISNQLPFIIFSFGTRLQIYFWQRNIQWMFQISQLSWCHFFCQKLSGLLSIHIFNSCSHGQRLFERFVKSRIQITFPQLMRRWHSRTFHFDVHGGQFSTYINVRHFEFITASKIYRKTKSCKNDIFQDIFRRFDFHEII